MDIKSGLSKTGNFIRKRKLLFIVLAGILAFGTLFAYAAGSDENTLTYNAKNEVTSGTYTEPNPPDDDHSFAGWATTKAKADAGTIDFSATPNDTSNTYLSAIGNGETKRVYAVWKIKPYVYYAVQIYGIETDKLKDGSTAGLTFGPATGNMFSSYTFYGSSEYNKNSSVSGKYIPCVNAHKINDSTYLINDDSVSKSATATGTETNSSGVPETEGTSITKGRTTVTKEMMQADMDAVQSEDEEALTDNGSNAITGNDAGTDSSGNTYRCIHYDNWKTILYWNDKDPHVYDKCVENHCSKKLILRPNARSTSLTGDRDTMNYNTKSSAPAGDGDVYIAQSCWDNSFDSTLAQDDYYSASFIRAKLVGSDSDTVCTSTIAGTDARTRFTEQTAYISAFPEELTAKMGEKKLTDITYSTTTPSDAKTVYDKLWLFSYEEEFRDSTQYTSRNAYGSDSRKNGARGSLSWWWLRSRGVGSGAGGVSGSGGSRYSGVNSNNGVAPGFSLSRN